MIPPGQSAGFVAQMEQVLDVYKRPYAPDRPVVCMDESPKQLISPARQGLAMVPGMEERQDYEYVRHGVANIFMANEPLKGKRVVEVTEKKTKRDWAAFIRELAETHYPRAEKITLVMDNFKTHCPSAFYEAFPPEEAKRLWDRFEFIFTPKHGSWLNMAEIELNVLNRQCLSRHMPSVERMRNEVRAWQDERNRKTAIIDWQFSKENARTKLKRLYPTVHA